jgi:hypothetical protein
VNARLRLAFDASRSDTRVYVCAHVSARRSALPLPSVPALSTSTATVCLHVLSYVRCVRYDGQTVLVFFFSVTLKFSRSLFPASWPVFLKHTNHNHPPLQSYLSHRHHTHHESRFIMFLEITSSLATMTSHPHPDVFDAAAPFGGFKVCPYSLYEIDLRWCLCRIGADLQKYRY